MVKCVLFDRTFSFETEMVDIDCFFIALPVVYIKKKMLTEITIFIIPISQVTFTFKNGIQIQM